MKAPISFTTHASMLLQGNKEQKALRQTETRQKFCLRATNLLEKGELIRMQKEKVRKIGEICFSIRNTEANYV